MYIYIYIYVYIYLYVYIYTYIYVYICRPQLTLGGASKTWDSWTGSRRTKPGTKTDVFLLEEVPGLIETAFCFHLHFFHRVF